MKKQKRKHQKSKYQKPTNLENKNADRYGNMYIGREGGGKEGVEVPKEEQEGEKISKKGRTKIGNGRN